LGQLPGLGNCHLGKVEALHLMPKACEPHPVTAFAVGHDEASPFTQMGPSCLQPLVGFLTEKKPGFGESPIPAIQ
jgi:hypothetical protein